MKLVQKRFLKGSREFEIVDDTVYVRIKSLFKEQKLTVDLSTLDPEPVINGSELAFYSPHKGRPVFSLLLNNPNAEKFNAFVDALKQKITGEDSAETVSPETAQSALARNVYEEPPEFVESDNAQNEISFQPVNAERLDNDITMLKTYLDEKDIKPLLDSLETLKAEPQNEAAFQKMMDAFNDLGINQGAVLTYATYLKVLASKSVRF
ncbi:hypothetical protein [Sulfuriflexus mobilis]|uniref:hypothetical protein n=1 Tax=Sulfuriflexus mobilis TaxID=1811807 RepID=UPI000F821D59|nr:hypothetical protein [Sulfuriflexus mobilis]